MSDEEGKWVEYTEVPTPGRRYRQTFTLVDRDTKNQIRWESWVPKLKQPQRRYAVIRAYVANRGKPIVLIRTGDIASHPWIWVGNTNTYYSEAEVWEVQKILYEGEAPEEPAATYPGTESA